MRFVGIEAQRLTKIKTNFMVKFLTQLSLKDTQCNFIAQVSRANSYHLPVNNWLCVCVCVCAGVCVRAYVSVFACACLCRGGTLHTACTNSSHRLVNICECVWCVSW